MQINIKATTATELCQIDKSVEKIIDGSNLSVITPIKQKVLTVNSRGKEVSFFTPIYSGNGVRGLLRRLSFQILLEKGIEKGFSITNPIDFHLMNAGGGNNYQRQSFDIEDRVRELNPVVSVFGASLAISGKLSTPNMIPYKEVDSKSGIKEYYTEENEETGKVYSPILIDEKFIKIDDLIERSGNARYVSDKLIEEWKEAVDINKKDVAKTRDSADKIKKEYIKSRLGREFVIRGVDFYSSIGELSTSQMSDIEKGMIYKALEIFVLENLGSNKSRGFGLMEYDISFDDGGVLKTKVNEYLEAEIIQRDYRDEVKRCIGVFEGWLDNDFCEDSFKLSEILV